MVQDRSFALRAFTIFNYIFLGLLALTCVLPFIHVIAVSLSSSQAITANRISLWPVDFNINAYGLLTRDTRFIRAFGISLARVVIGTSLSMLFIILTAYPLSRESSEFRGRNWLVWFFVIPMLFSGGLIPTFLLIRDLRLLDSFWVFVIPGAVPVFSTFMLMNAFRNLPKDLYEAAIMDGANHIQVLFRIYLPITGATLATLVLFSMVGQWNSWFDGLIYINNPEKWPLQTLMRSIILQKDALKSVSESLTLDEIKRLAVNNTALEYAQIVIAMVPILLIYPLLQRHFVKGIVIGAVKE